ncbi:MAG: hypothetical protein FWH19_00690 [Treponema sp.]|nr:hypothetical protein [Treponema sp.]
MKKKCFGLVIFSLLTLLFISCPGTPAVQEPLSEAEQIALDALNAAVARAAEARQQAADFDGEEFFPSEWESAEDLYNQARQQRDTSSASATRESTARFNRAADAFDEIFRRSLAENLECAEMEIAEARRAAVAAGAEERAPSYLADADNIVTRARGEFDAGDYSAARASVMDALTIYDAIKAGLDALRMREEIENRGFEEYDRASFEAGNSALLAGRDQYSAGNYDGALNSAKAALAAYGQTLRAAMLEHIGDIRSEASAERQRALDARANVAAREEFEPGDFLYTRANAELQRQNIADAGMLFFESIPRFTASIQLAMERRLAAEEALRRADQRVAESDEIARQAEDLLIEQGGL